MIKAIFFDIDGTLVSLKNRVYCPSLPDTIRQLRERGILLYIATGRSKFEISEEHLLDGLSFDGYLTNNGQDCYDANGKSIYSKPLAKSEVAAVLSWAKANDQPCWVVSDKRSRISKEDATVRSQMAYIHTRTPDIGSLDEMLEEEVYKIVLFLDRDAIQAPLKLAPTCRWTQWSDFGCDIISQDGGKVNALREIIEAKGISLEEVMAFGDSHNDIEMLRAAGIGVAMDNATDECKAAADYITDSCENDGISSALRHFGLIK